MIPKFEKSFSLVCRARWDEFIDIEFDQYSRLSIRLNIFLFSAKIAKTNLKKLFIS